MPWSAKRSTSRARPRRRGDRSRVSHAMSASRPRLRKPSPASEKKRQPAEATADTVTTAAGTPAARLSSPLRADAGVTPSRGYERYRSSIVPPTLHGPDSPCRRAPTLLAGTLWQPALGVDRRLDNEHHRVIVPRKRLELRRPGSFSVCLHAFPRLRFFPHAHRRPSSRPDLTRAQRMKIASTDSRGSSRRGTSSGRPAARPASFSPPTPN